MLFAIAFLASAPVFAQGGMGFNPSGVWTELHHEDELERTHPGSPAGDHLQIPSNDDARPRDNTQPVS